MSQPRFRPFEARGHITSAEDEEGTCVSFTERVFPWGHAGDFWITIRAFDRNLYGKEADGAFGIKEVREPRTRAYLWVRSVSPLPRARRGSLNIQPKHRPE